MNEIFEDALHKFVTTEALPAPLSEAVEYALFPGGKRIRPLFALEYFGELSGEDTKMFLPIACSLEFLHASSLVHDDLPALDDDNFRRGKPSLHRAFNEGTAILAGDALISMAFKVIFKSEFDEKLKNHFLEEISSAFLHLCSGQQLDLLPHASIEEIIQIHRLKTGALFGAAFAVSAIAARGKDTEVIQRSRSLGMSLGISFQILDDYLDVFGNDAERGRGGSSDSRAGKKTIFIGYSFESATAIWRKLLGEIDADLNFLKRMRPLPKTEARINSLLSRFESIKIAV